MNDENAKILMINFRIVNKEREIIEKDSEK